MENLRFFLLLEMEDSENYFWSKNRGEPSILKENYQIDNPILYIFFVRKIMNGNLHTERECYLKHDIWFHIHKWKRGMTGIIKG